MVSGRRFGVVFVFAVAWLPICWPEPGLLTVNICPCIPSRLISRFKHLTSTISYFNLALTIELSSSSYYSSCASSSKQHLFSCSYLPASTQATCSYYQVACWASNIISGTPDSIWLPFTCYFPSNFTPSLLYKPMVTFKLSSRLQEHYTGLPFKEPRSSLVPQGLNLVFVSFKCTVQDSAS
eukprot:scaffold40171_cov59-Cyclotella_meneghiniana.AAC.1